MSIDAGPRRDTPQFDVLDPVMADALRAMSPAERLAIGHAMWRSARDMLRNLIRAEHPEWSDAEVNLAAARRLQHGALTCKPSGEIVESKDDSIPFKE